MGLVQGLTELFPISSLGHSVIIAWILNWHGILADETKSESFFLSFLVVLHVATALALLIFYRTTWVRIIRGFFSSIRQRNISSSDDRLAWLLIVATIPAGLVGLAFQSFLRIQFAKPLSAIVFLFINGCILLIGDRYQRKTVVKQRSAPRTVYDSTKHVSQTLTMQRSIIIGVAQIAAFIAGISRSGITMVSGLYSGLNNEDAARFAFLLSTPIIFGAGLVELPDVFGKVDAGVHGQLLAGGVAAGLAAYMAVRYLDRYFSDKTLRPFGIYCVSASGLLLILGLIRGGF